jgi:exodeoxyribonuclease-1
MQQFHSGDWHKRAEIAECFEDARYRELARRLVFENATQALTSARREQLQAWQKNRRLGREDVVAGRTIPGTLTELEEIEAADQAEAIKVWLEGLES